MEYNWNIKEKFHEDLSLSTLFTQDTFAFQSLIAFKCLFQVHHLPTVTDREFKSAKLLCSYEPFDLFFLFGIKREHIYVWMSIYVV